MNNSQFEIRNDDSGQLDEVVACHPKFFHLERMGDGAWWIGLESSDGHYFHINLGTRPGSRAIVDGHIEDNGLGPQPHQCSLKGCPGVIQKK